MRSSEDVKGPSPDRRAIDLLRGNSISMIACEPLDHVALGASASCCGSFGELLQGALPDVGPFLATLPILARAVGIGARVDAQHADQRATWGRRQNIEAQSLDTGMEDPQTSLVNLVEIMLVFICGLIVALVSAQRHRQTGATYAQQQVIEQGREHTELPEGLRGQQAGEGMQPVVQVFKDPKTGKLVLVGH